MALHFGGLFLHKVNMDNLKIIKFKLYYEIIFCSLLMWIFDRYSPYSYQNNREKYKDDDEKREFTLKECLWFCMTSLTPQGGGDILICMMQNVDEILIISRFFPFRRGTEKLVRSVDCCDLVAVWVWKND